MDSANSAVAEAPHLLTLAHHRLIHALAHHLAAIVRQLQQQSIDRLPHQRRPMRLLPTPQLLYMTIRAQGSGVE